MVQMARNLVNMHNQVAGGDYSYVETLRKLPQLNCAGSSQRDQVMYNIYMLPIELSLIACRHRAAIEPCAHTAFQIL